MGIVLKGIEIENFKSYAMRQKISFSDMSVLLGANSSGKSTALQALLAIKQTMECNSPDEELLLSGKYVTLGDFDDVISNPENRNFSFSVFMDQTERNENSLDEDDFKITWCFERDDDEISAILKQLDIIYETLQLSFRRSKNGLHDLYLNGERSPFSLKINHLLFSQYYINYDEELNNHGVDLLNDLSHELISKKILNLPNHEPISVDEMEHFYYRIMDRLQEEAINRKNPPEEILTFAKEIVSLLDQYGNAVMPQYETYGHIFPSDLKVRIIELALMEKSSYDVVHKIVNKYKDIIDKYKKENHPVDQFTGVYPLGRKLFTPFSMEEEKKDIWTQLKYALDFYEQFYSEIEAKIFFVGPIREMPKGLYNIGFETVPKYVGPTGSYFASVLLHENKKIREYILPDGSEEKCTLSEALAEWMMHLNIASNVDVDKKNSFGFSVSIENMEQVKSDIMNVGIGTSQVLPVLISVLLSDEKEILVFEQPELHLHPYSQSRLADLFVAFCKVGRKIIVETHSEYFMLRLRYHIVKGNLDKEAAGINFFQNIGGTKVKKSNISGLGNIEYPEDFRDETQELLDDILHAALARKGLA